MSHSIAVEPLRKYARFRGRASRAEFWLFMGWTLGVAVALEAVAIGLGSLDDPAGLVLYESGPLMLVAIASLVWWFALIVPACAVTARRLHDTGRSGWLIPIVGWIILAVWCARRGDAGANVYGEPTG